jgi:hypothetical protein
MGRSNRRDLLLLQLWARICWVLLLQPQIFSACVLRVLLLLVVHKRRDAAIGADDAYIGRCMQTDMTCCALFRVAARIFTVQLCTVPAPAPVVLTACSTQKQQEPPHLSLSD